MLNTFKTGDEVPQSGVYAILHSTPHMLIGRQMCVAGSRFRGCRMCPFGVLYRLEEPCVPTAFPVLAGPGLAAC